MTVPKLALTWEEAAEASGYSVRTLKQAVYDGNLMARYANTKAVIRVEDLAKWLDELPAEPPSHRA
ncbi:helix-turn-helix domain-containing protein [Arthrobacter sp. D3-18]